MTVQTPLRPGVFGIGSARIGAGRCFVIAEAGVNHSGDADKALRLSGRQRQGRAISYI